MKKAAKAGLAGFFPPEQQSPPPGTPAPSLPPPTYMKVSMVEGPFTADCYVGQGWQLRWVHRDGWFRYAELLVAGQPVHLPVPGKSHIRQYLRDNLQLDLEHL